jgi:hypothetical protein
MDTDRDQRVVLGLLLERHPAMQTLEDLRAELPNVAVDHALEQLRQDGLVNSLGEIAGASRAAVRADQLSR